MGGRGCEASGRRKASRLCASRFREEIRSGTLQVPDPVGKVRDGLAVGEGSVPFDRSRRLCSDTSAPPRRTRCDPAE